MEIIDNVNRLLGDDLKRSIRPGAKISIAASSFSIYAYEALRHELEQIESLDFIFTTPTFVPSENVDQLKREHREFYMPKVSVEQGFFGSEFEIQLRNQLTQRAIAKECAAWIQRKAHFRSNRSGAPMQQFTCVDVPGSETVYMPLHGFTAVDLGYQQGNAVSNIVNRFDEPEATKTFLSLFAQIWKDQDKLTEVTDIICDHIASVYKENSPERIYFLMLNSIFSEFLEEVTEDVLPNERTGYQNSVIWEKLYHFQRDAATGIINKLETYSGCILADSVGLGKTFTALAVVKYYELRNRSVLVLCPKKLSDNWVTYTKNLKNNPLVKDRFSYDVLCHTDLLREGGESLGIPLSRVNWGNYDLVVIDESHNFRNNDAFKNRETRYQWLMNKIIKQGVKTKVLMLSATPVNNRFNDLKNQLALAYEGQPESLSSKLKSTRNIDQIFRRAQAAFNMWSKLPAEERTPPAILAALDFDFFELLDSVTIARSRRHITTFYDTTEIGDFPTRRKPLSFHCALTQRPDVIGFNQIFAELSSLRLSVYTPTSFILPSRLSKYEDIYDTEVSTGGGRLKQRDRELSLRSLMTVNLLKRLESSVASFRLTLQKLQSIHLTTLTRIENYRKTGVGGTVSDISSFIEDADPDEDVDFLDPSEEESEDQTFGKVNIRLADMDLPAWEHSLKADLSVIEGLLSEMQKVSPADDTKLQHLKELILAKVENPINPGNRKILVFTAFADTAEYLYEHLAPVLQERHELHTARVVGSDRPRSTLGRRADFQEILTLFSPRSKEKDLLMPEVKDEIDLMIATDCISEGQNLQDCDYLINYDIHWNPVRIIQRFGRIDRIGSKNASIQLVNYWPDISLDEYIKLKERVESRMVIADVTATGDDNPLDGKSNDLAYRKEQLRRLQEEVIELEDLKAGVSITDLGLNDFRMDLLNYIKTHADLNRLPNGMHAVLPAAPDRGLPPGVIFALRNRNHNVNLNQINRLHPYYLVYVGMDGKPVVPHTEVKRLLDLVRSVCKPAGEPIPAAYQPFNACTEDGRSMGTYSNLLNAAIASILQLKEEKDLDSLFSGQKTTALAGKASGADDFELIAFLVVQPIPEPASSTSV
jgi:Helicase conserved C-terminal domain/SNF2-related domain